MTVRPFRIDVPEATLAALRSRLDQVCWPARLPAPGWEAGAPLDSMRELVEHWRWDFDWAAQQAYLNSFPQFLAPVDGVDIHFVHVQGTGPKPFPLVLTHGWPSTFAELLPLVPLLTDPAAHGGSAADSFDVVIPSLPGYGFSGRLAEPGQTGRAEMAARWRRLMTDVLGYHRFGAQGQDIGARATLGLAELHADVVAGIHVTGMFAPAPQDRELTDEERQRLAEMQRWQQWESAYALQQATYPMTLAYGLTDSPVGLAAWIADKARAWSDQEDGRGLGRDWILTTAMIYWVTGTIGSSFLPYYEGRANWGQPPPRIEVPLGIVQFPKDIPMPPRAWIEQIYDVARWTDMPRGGHFPASEEPELLAADLREFFRPLR